MFNRKLLLDILYIYGRPVLHDVEKNTNYGAARFVLTGTRNPTTEQVWRYFLHYWALLYTGGLPYFIHTDSGSCSTSKPWEFFMSANRIDHIVSGVESHHSIDAGEQAHHPLRRICFKVRPDHPSITQAMALQLARKAMNETSGPVELVPLLLVYGTMPSYKHVGLSGNIENKEHFQAVITAQKEYLEQVNEARVRKLLHSNSSWTKSVRCKKWGPDMGGFFISIAVRLD